MKKLILTHLTTGIILFSSAAFITFPVKVSEASATITGPQNFITDIAVSANSDVSQAPSSSLSPIIYSGSSDQNITYNPGVKVTVNIITPVHIIQLLVE